MFFILAACLICWSKSSPVKWGSAVLRDEYDYVQDSKLKKSSGRLLATNWRNIVARFKFLVASLYNVNDAAHRQGFWYFALSQSHKIDQNTQNTTNSVEIATYQKPCIVGCDPSDLKISLREVSINMEVNWLCLCDLAHFYDESKAG